jgi:hypothetical protein
MNEKITGMAKNEKQEVIIFVKPDMRLTEDFDITSVFMRI